MALAPKARSFTLYEVGRDGTLFGDIMVPPLPSINTVKNTLASSTLPSAVVAGEPAIYVPLYPRVAALRDRSAAVRDRRIALEKRVSALEAQIG